jgi:hypothetical protein
MLTGGTNTGGTNAAGTNTGGTNAAGTNTGGTNTGGTNTGGTNTGGMNTAGGAGAGGSAGGGVAGVSGFASGGMAGVGGSASGGVAGVGEMGKGGAGAGGMGGAAGAGGGGATHPGNAVSFGGHWYRFTQASIAGADARSICSGLGGYLACIETQAEDAFLLTLAGTARPWFGLNNLANVNTWVWVNGSPLQYTHWLPGQPDSPANERWGKMLEDGSWDDGSIPTSYICEWDR